MSDENEVDNQYEYQSEVETEEEQPQQQVVTPAQPKPARTMQGARKNRQQQVARAPPQYDNVPTTNTQQVMIPAQQAERVTGNMGGRTGAIRESRIKDRPQPKEVRDSSLKIKIELDLEVEVDLYARVKGDVTIGLM